jgi:GTP cyclohydrolase I
MDDCAERARNAVSRFALHSPGPFEVFGVPRGGIVPALLVVSALKALGYDAFITEVAKEADIIVDDVIDSGSTRERYRAVNPRALFVALVDKSIEKTTWIVFPWEVNEEGSKEDVVLRMLQAIGEDVTREGLAETPARVVKAWSAWFSGYSMNPADVLKTFKDGAEGVDEMVLETDIPVYSFCEHHMAPIFGVAHVAYIPNGKVVGLSKLVRLVDIFARRLQVQERLTNQIADAIESNLSPLGVGVVLQCRHMCMESRGVHQHGVVTTTSSLRGAIKHEHDARSEFLTLVSMSKSRHSSIL